jgi:hypothetical protein
MKKSPKYWRVLPKNIEFAVFVRECKTGSTGKPAVKSLTKRNYLTRVYARVLAASGKCR